MFNMVFFKCIVLNNDISHNLLISISSFTFSQYCEVDAYNISCIELSSVLSVFACTNSSKPGFYRYWCTLPLTFSQLLSYRYRITVNQI